MEKKAKTMFQKLGWKIGGGDFDSDIIYYREKTHSYQQGNDIGFEIRIATIKFNEILKDFILNEVVKVYTIKDCEKLFMNYGIPVEEHNEQTCTVEARTYPYIVEMSPEELQAINKQVEELGWKKEKENE